MMTRTDSGPEIRYTVPTTRAAIAAAGVRLTVDLDCDEGLRAVAVLREGETWAERTHVRYGVEARGASLGEALAGAPESWREIARSGSERHPLSGSERARRLFDVVEREIIDADEARWLAIEDVARRDAAANGDEAAERALAS